jgi:hypothetical protein
MGTEVYAPQVAFSYSAASGGLAVLHLICEFAEAG